MPMDAYVAFIIVNFKMVCKVLNIFTIQWFFLILKYWLISLNLVGAKISDKDVFMSRPLNIKTRGKWRLFSPSHWNIVRFSYKRKENHTITKKTTESFKKYQIIKLKDIFWHIHIQNYVWKSIKQNMIFFFLKHLQFVYCLFVQKKPKSNTTTVCN